MSAGISWVTFALRRSVRINFIWRFVAAKSGGYHPIFHPILPKSKCVPYPVSVIIALHEEGAWLRVRDGEDIFVPKYGAVVFRGDLTHAGAEWTGASFNWRIHLYYDTQGPSWSCKVPRVGREARGGRHIQVIRPPARAERADAAA